MFNRKDIAEELLLRENVRKAVRHVIKRRRESILKEERQLRSIISSLITEAVQKKYDHMGLSKLADFMAEVVGTLDNPDGNPAFKNAYTDLSTNKEDRQSFVEIIIDLANQDFDMIDAGQKLSSLNDDFVQNGFETEEEEVELPGEPEPQGGIKITTQQDVENNGGDVLADTEPLEEPLEEAEEDISTVVEDSSVEEYAREAYKSIGAAARNYYRQVLPDRYINKEIVIDDQQYAPGTLSERELFRAYFGKNIELWADKYEEEFFGDAEEEQIELPAEPEADLPADTEEVEDFETEVPEITLEEVSINVDDFIKNILK